MSDHERWAWRPQEGRSRRWWSGFEVSWSKLRPISRSLQLILSRPRAYGAPPGNRNGQYRDGERTKAAIAAPKFSALLKMLAAGLS
jgi:hypothetical protein